MRARYPGDYDKLATRPSFLIPHLLKLARSER